MAGTYLCGPPKFKLQARQIQLSAEEFVRTKLHFQPDPKQQEVLGWEGKRGILNCSRQWGKSSITAAMAIHRACSQPDSLILVASPSERQSAEFIKKAEAMARPLELRIKGDGANAISLQFPNRSRIVGLPGKEGTVRGFSAVSLLIIDEAARVPDDIYKALRPMLAVGGGDLFLVSTPLGKRGFFYETWEHGGPQWKRLCVPATECPRIPSDYLDEERQVLGEQWFRQEYLCEFLDTDCGMFSRDLLERALDPTIRQLFL